MKDSFCKLMAFLGLLMVGATPSMDLTETRFKQQVSTSEPAWVVLVHPWGEDSLKLERLAKLANIWENIIWVDVTKKWSKAYWGENNALLKKLPTALKYENGRISQIRRGNNKILVFLLANIDTK